MNYFLIYKLLDDLIASVGFFYAVFLVTHINYINFYSLIGIFVWTTIPLFYRILPATIHRERYREDKIKYYLFSCLKELKIDNARRAVLSYEDETVNLTIRKNNKK